jgi:stage II sporulation SpoAA-like protein
MSGFEVVGEEGGIVRVMVDGSLMRRSSAEVLCGAIESAAAGAPARARLLMDLGALSRATPAAGLYAMRRMKELDFEAIALYRGNGFMRAFARTVMRLARFGAFELFSDEDSARRWLAAMGRRSAPETS